VLIGDIAIMDLTLAFRAQERRVDEDEAAEDPPTSTRHHRCGHAPHRVAKQNRTRELEAMDEAHDVAREIFVTVPVVRRARTTVRSCVGHDDVELSLERARQGIPAGATPHQSMEQNDRRFGASRSEVVDADAVRFADSADPGHHRHCFATLIS
jgi:hypothetical protein